MAEVTANERQVGGQHYGLQPIQHWDVVMLFGLDYFQGNITKYVMRWREKGGVQDLEKAQHYLQKYIEIQKAIKEGRNEYARQIFAKSLLALLEDDDTMRDKATLERLLRDVLG